MTNKFFTYTDPKLKDNTLFFPLDENFFWSRFYEYEFVKQFINKSDTVCDMACGTDSLFKFELTNLSDNVYACDIEDMSWDNIQQSIEQRYKADIESMRGLNYLYDKLHLTQCSIDSTPYLDGQFDKIICISVFEHLDEDLQISTLKEFKRVLKDNGKIILTCDYPTIRPLTLLKIANRIGLQIDGNYDYSIPENHIQTDYFGYNCKCFSMILRKRKGENL